MLVEEHHKSRPDSMIDGILSGWRRHSGDWEELYGKEADKDLSETQGSLKREELNCENSPTSGC